MEKEDLPDYNEPVEWVNWPLLAAVAVTCLLVLWLCVDVGVCGG